MADSNLIFEWNFNTFPDFQQARNDQNKNLEISKGLDIFHKGGSQGHLKPIPTSDKKEVRKDDIKEEVAVQEDDPFNFLKGTE